MPLRKPTKRRRQPQQRRARETVDAVLEAVRRILKRQGVSAVTTNRIAEVAGVSIGSVYQYFPDKQAIYLALHEQHVERSISLLERVLVECADAPLETFVRALLESLVDAHAGDPELYELLQREVPYRTDAARQFEDSLHGALKLALSSRAPAPLGRQRLERKLFVAVHMLDALAHGVVLGRRPGLSFSAAKDEAARALLLYLRAP